MFSHENEFERQGFTVLRKIIPLWERKAILRRVSSCLDPLVGRVEYESDVGYPGAPKSREAAGGIIPRRLLGALDRDGVFLSLALNPTIVEMLRKFLGCPEIAVSRAHHNCVMTKFPEFSSDTHWHRDSRYWAFEKSELVTAWYALGEETQENGGLSVIPGSHGMNLNGRRFNDQSFFRADDPRNITLIETAVDIRLNPGDVLLFHCQLIHSATRNLTMTPKFSAVFTYHSVNNRPKPGTRSSSLPSLRIR